MKKIILTILILTGLAVSTSALAWFDSSYLNRREVTINSSQIATTTDSFVILATTTIAELKTAANGGNVQSDTGLDIIWVDDDDSTLLNFEYESYASTTGAIVHWISTDISSTSDKAIYMYYGKQGSIEDISHATTTWANSGAVGVWHLKESTSTDSYAYDSTDNDGDGTFTNTGGEYQVSGQIGGAVDFDGDDDYINLGNKSQFNLNATWTYSFWANLDDDTDATYQAFFSKGYGSAGGGAYNPMFLGTHDNLYTFMRFADNSAYYYNEYTDFSIAFKDKWVKVTQTFESGYMQLYINGNLHHQRELGSPSVYQNALNLEFGTNTVYGAYYDGEIDEIRMYDQSLTQADITTIYNMEHDNDAFLDFGSEVPRTTLGVFTISSWIKPTTSITSKALFVKEDQVRLATDSNGKPICQIHNDTSYQQAVTSSDALSLNEWSYLTCTYDRSNIKIFIDGILKGSIAMSADIKDTINDLKLGTDDSSEYNDFQGYMDEFKHYKYARTANQIKTDYNSVSLLGASSRSVTVGQSRDPSEGLVAHFKFDETALNGCGTNTDACDSSGNLNHLTAIADAAPTSTAKYGWAATFDGTGDYYCSDPDDDGDCDHDDALDMGTSDFTIETWVNITTLDGSRRDIVQKNEDYDLRISTNNKLQFAIPGIAAATEDTTVLSTGQWYHFVIVYDQNRDKIYYYIDGDLKTYPSFSSNGSGADDALTLGSYDGSQNYFDGQIDDVKIYNKARSASQIRKDYLTGPPPVGHWKFDENSGSTLYDTAGSNNGDLNLDDGTPAGTSSAWTSGKYGSALSFDGTDDYVDIGNDSSLNITGNLTICAWVKPKVSSLTGGIVDRYYWNSGVDNGGYNFILDSGKVRFEVFDDCGSYSNVGDVVLNVEQWHFVCGRYNGVTNKVYVDGIEDESLNWTTNPKSVSEDFYIGNRRVTNNVVFNGAIDDVRIYNYARTQRQIMEDMNAGHPAVGSPVGSYVGYWKFDEGYGQTLYDSSVNGNNFTLATTTNPDGCDPSWTTDGKFNHAMEFDGVDDYIYMADDVEFQDLNEGTISMWLYPTAADDIFFYYPQGTGSYSDYLRMRMTDSGEFQYSAEVGDVVVISIISDVIATYNTWHHIVVTQDGSTSKMYVNGVLQKDTDSGEWFNDSITDGVLKIGDDSWGDLEFAGKMDELKIYPFALTPEEVLLEYNGGASLVLGSKGTAPTGGAGAGTSTNSALIEYCVPGGTDQCDPPVAHWKFDERSGSTLYDTVGSNDGDLNLDDSSASATTSAWKSAGQCHSGSCLDFDGVNDYITMGDVHDMGTNDFTVSAWMKTTDVTNNTWKRRIFGKGYLADGYSVYVNIDGTVYYYSNSAASSGTTATVDDGLWHHVVATRASSTIQIYVDGVLDEANYERGEFGVDLDNGENFTVGVLQDGGTTAGHWNGLIDDVRVYDYVRTAAQVAWEYNRGKPVGHWTMDSIGYAANSSSTIYDASGNGNDGIYNNEIMNNGTTTASTKPTWKPNRDCKYGTCLEFDGVDDYVLVPNVADLQFNSGTQDFTLEAWIKSPDINNTAYIMDKRDGDNDGWRFITTPTYRISVSIDTIDLWSATNALLDNTWQHVVFVADRDGNGQIYVDGVASGAAVALSSEAMDTTVNLHIGRRSDDTQNYFDGQIDEVRIYNTALSATQIEALYLNNDRSAGASKEPNLVGEWRFDEGGGSEMADTHYQRYGKRNYAIEFDGVDDYVDITSNFDELNTVGTGNYSLSTWLKTSENDVDYDYVLNLTQTDDNDQILLSIGDGSTAGIVLLRSRASATNSDTKTTQTYNDGNWHHIVGVRDTSGTKQYIYVDGVLIKEATVTARNVQIDGTASHRIGIHHDDSVPFNGQIDEVKIFNYALTAEQIRNVYNQGAVRFGPSSGLP